MISTMASVVITGFLQFSRIITPIEMMLFLKLIFNPDFKIMVT